MFLRKFMELFYDWHFPKTWRDLIQIWWYVFQEYFASQMMAYTNSFPGRKKLMY